MPSRSLDALRPDVAAMARAMLAACQAAGLDVLVTCTLRSNDEQAALYAQGRTKPGRVVTWAGPGQSLHNPDELGKSRAFDVVPMRAGQCVWGTDGADAVLWQRVGEIGESVGLEWGGRWPDRNRDRPHFQIQGGRA